ncbi:MAG: hypothetical protein ACI4FY_11030 [Acetatifactor sp.]
MKKMSLKLMGLMLAAVLCFGGCGKEAAPADGSSESISSESVTDSTVESSTESVASSESDLKRESSEESVSVEESIEQSQASEDDYLAPIKQCMEAAVDGKLMKLFDAMPEKYSDAFFEGMMALGMTRQDIEEAFTMEPEEGAADLQFRYGEATPKTADEIAAYSAILNDIAPMEVTEGYSVMVYAVEPDGEESSQPFDVYKVDGVWTISIDAMGGADVEDDFDEPEKEYTFDNYTTLEEYYKIPSVAETIEQEMEQVREQFKSVYDDCTFMAIDNVIYYDYYFLEGVEATEENRKKMEDAFPATAEQLKSVMDALEAATGIRPEKIVCSYYTYDWKEIFVGEVE